MPRDSRIQMIGSEADLQPASPTDERFLPEGIPAGTMQMTGSEAGLKYQGTPAEIFDKHPADGGGAIDMIGSQAELRSTDSHIQGWESHPTPVSAESEVGIRGSDYFKPGTGRSARKSST